MIYYEKNGFTSIDNKRDAQFVPFHVISRSLKEPAIGEALGYVKYDWNGNILSSAPGVTAGGFIILHYNEIMLVYTSASSFEVYVDPKVTEDMIRAFDWHLLSPVSYESSYSSVLLRSRPASYLPFEGGCIFSNSGHAESPFLPDFDQAVLSRYSVQALFGSRVDISGFAIAPTSRKAALAYFVNPSFVSTAASLKRFGFIKTSAGSNAAKSFQEGASKIDFSFSKNYSLPPSKLLKAGFTPTLLKVAPFGDNVHVLSASRIEYDFDDLKGFLLREGNGFVLDNDEAITKFIERRDAFIEEAKADYDQAAISCIKSAVQTLRTALSESFADRILAVPFTAEDGYSYGSTFNEIELPDCDSAFPALKTIDCSSAEAASKSLEIAGSFVTVNRGEIELDDEAPSAVRAKFDLALSEMKTKILALSDALRTDKPKVNMAFRAQCDAGVWFWKTSKPGYGGSNDGSSIILYPDSGAKRLSATGLGDFDSAARVLSASLKGSADPAGNFFGSLNIVLTANPIAICCPDTEWTVDRDRKAVVESIVAKYFAGATVTQIGISPTPGLYSDWEVADIRYFIGAGVKGYNHCKYTKAMTYLVKVPVNFVVAPSPSSVLTDLARDKAKVIAASTTAWIASYIQEHGLRNVTPAVQYGVLYCSFDGVFDALGIVPDKEACKTLVELCRSVTDEQFSTFVEPYLRQIEALPSEEKECCWVADRDSLIETSGIVDYNMLPFYWAY